MLVWVLKKAKQRQNRCVVPQEHERDEALARLSTAEPNCRQKQEECAIPLSDLQRVDQSGRISQPLFRSAVRNFTPTVFRNAPAGATGQECHLKRNELLPVHGDAESHLLFRWNFNGWFPVLRGADCCQ